MNKKTSRRVQRAFQFVAVAGFALTMVGLISLQAHMGGGAMAISGGIMIAIGSIFGGAL